LAGRGDLEGKVESYIRVQLDVMTDGRYAAAVALAEHAPAEPALERIRAGHARLLRPLVAALEGGGVPRATLRAELIQGMVDAAARLAQRTPGDAEEIIEATVAQATHGLR